jgi:hypothetical protein
MNIIFTFELIPLYLQSYNRFNEPFKYNIHIPLYIKILPLICSDAILKQRMSVLRVNVVMEQYITLWVIILGVKNGRRVGLTTLPPSMSRMSENVEVSTSRNPKGLHGLYRDNFTFLWVKAQGS